LTVSGVGLGTLAYMAPEQIAEARHVDTGADIYALGATIYHALAGDPPFQVRSVEELMALQETPAPFLSSVCPKAPPELSLLLQAMLEKEAWDRPPNAQDAAGHLSRLRQHYFPGSP
jgi:serine/threonine protein kinase